MPPLAAGATPRDWRAGAGSCAAIVLWGTMILVVGKPSGWTTLARALPRGETLRFVAIEDLTAAHLRELRPDLVLSPLMGDGFDAVEVAQRLAKAGFRGRFRVVAPPLLNPNVVRAEVQEAAEEIDFDLVVIGGRPH